MLRRMLHTAGTLPSIEAALDAGLSFSLAESPSVRLMEEDLSRERKTVGSGQSARSRFVA